MCLQGKKPGISTSRSVMSLASAALLLTSTVVFSQTNLGIIQAVRDQDFATVRRLLQKHVDLNAPGPDGVTALHWAAQLNDVPAAQMLLRAGARANIANDYGVTPLWLACLNGSSPMTSELLRAHANANATLP